MISYCFSSKKATLLAGLLTLPLFIVLIYKSYTLPKPDVSALLAPLTTPIEQKTDELLFDSVEPELTDLSVNEQPKPLDFAGVTKQISENESERKIDSLGSSLNLNTKSDEKFAINQFEVKGDIQAPMLRLNITPYNNRMLAKLASKGVASVVLNTSQGWYSASLTSSGKVARIEPARINLSKRSVDIPQVLIDEVTSQFDKVIGFYEVSWVKLVFTQQLDYRLHQFSLAHPEVKMINLSFDERDELVLTAPQ